MSQYIFEIAVEFSDERELSSKDLADIRNNFRNRLKGFYTTTPKALTDAEVNIKLPKNKRLTA